MAKVAFDVASPQRSVEEQVRGIGLCSALLASDECVANLQLVGNVMNLLTLFLESKESRVQEAAKRILSLMSCK